MSEVNLNETFEETMDDATVITVPIDDTLTNSGEAADAAAVGAALALKADISQVTGISVNGENPDAQGAILLDASEIPMTDTAGADSVAEAIAEIDGKTAEDIVMGSEDETTIAEKISDTLTKSEQELTAEEKAQVRENIEAAGAEDLAGIGSGSKLLDAALAFGTSYSTTNRTFTLDKTSAVTITQNYNAGQPLAIGCKAANTSGSATLLIAHGIDGEDTSGVTASGVLPAGTYYVWGKRKTSSTTGNGCIVWAYPITV